MYANDAELNNTKQLNRYLLPDLLCVPPYNSVNGKWIAECFEKINSGNQDKLKYHVTKEIVLPWRRAYQTTYFYTELEPFIPFVKVIDAATIAYFQDNFFCSYMTILPVVEGVLDMWGNELPNYPQGTKIIPKLKCIFNFIESKLDLNIYFYNFLIQQYDFLKKILENDFYSYGTAYLQKGNKKAFNRNVVSHLLETPDYFTSNLHTLRVFLLLDILARLYVHANSGKHLKLQSCFDADYKPEMMDLYFSVYKSCAIRAMDEGSYNISLENKIYNRYNM